MKIIILTGVVCLMITGVPAQARQNLQVMFDGAGCPTEVISHDNSCGGGSDPVNQACRPKNGPVRWAPVNAISEINTKAGSEGGLHNCKAKPNQGYYQCIVRGNSGDHVEYFVTATNGCTLDPVIIVQ